MPPNLLYLAEPSAIDVDALYRAHAAGLEQIVRRAVRAPGAVVEDACQFAWSKLVHHAGRVREECALSWLATTAIHEAFRLADRDGRELSLELPLGDAGDDLADLIAASAPEPHEVVEQRLRLEALVALPERQQRMLWLHAFGLSYAEIALLTGCSLRTVERQLLRAKRSARALAA